MGTTGAGKSTVIDIFLGLLTPNKGQLLVDGFKIEGDKVREWQAGIGYVPRRSFIDGTISANIALGVPIEEVDLERVKWAAKQAQIHDFVVKELTSGYDSEVGEQGVRLSMDNAKGLV